MMQQDGAMFWENKYTPGSGTKARQTYVNY